MSDVCLVSSELGVHTLDSSFTSLSTSHPSLFLGPDIEGPLEAVMLALALRAVNGSWTTSREQKTLRQRAQASEI
jgi:hypothetical protein